MDVFTDVLRLIRLRGSIFFLSDLSAPWGLTLSTAEGPRFHIILKGQCLLQTETMDEPLTLNQGDTVLLTHGIAHWIADSPNSQRVSSDFATTSAAQGNPLFQGETVSTRLMCGLYRYDETIQHPLLNTLPDSIHIKKNHAVELAWLQHSGVLLNKEVSEAKPGSAVLVDRLCEILFIQTLRHYQESQQKPHGFLAALYDPYISTALQLIHAQPATRWTIEKLARNIGLSRSAFAHRFRHLVGIPPMTYLTSWRMQRALDLLGNPDCTLSAIAAEVGYSSEMAFSKTFKRFFQKSPGEVRKQRYLWK